MRAKSKLRRRINPRLLVLLGLILIVVLGLGGLAVAGILFNLNSDETPPPEDNISTPQTPVEAEVPPTPTDTPTATSTPELASPTSAPKLQLPTARPTDLPTPIATQVVSPTPPGD
jgi:cytoskeletal protein RodZ